MYINKMNSLWLCVETMYTEKISKEEFVVLSTLENKPYKIDYYAILQGNEEDWASDAKWKDTFEQINIYDDPIIYTANDKLFTEGLLELVAD